MNVTSQFDHHADTYEADLNQALSASGENKDYFARGRVGWLARCLRQLRVEPRSAIDFGCGIGDTSVLLREALSLNSVLGLDVSVRSLELATLRNASSGCRFITFQAHVPGGDVDLVYCNGVFHHIPIGERDSALDYILRCLTPGGVFALWENNPWNPGARYVMSQCAFDRNAIPLSPRKAVSMLQRRGFQIISVDFLFFFPRFLKSLRFLEPHFSGIPLGAQYQVLCRRPAF